MAERKPRVLCLDDLGEHLRLRKIFLELFGCEVTGVEDTRSCLGAAESNAFDVAILDYHLSEKLTGENVARTLRERRPALPLIMLTGDPRVPQSARESVDAVLIKGASNPNDLLDLIEKLSPECRLKPRQKPVSREAWQNAETQKIGGRVRI